MKILYVTRLSGARSRGGAGGAEVFSRNLFKFFYRFEDINFDILTSDKRNNIYQDNKSVNKVYDSVFTRFTENQFLNINVFYRYKLIGAAAFFYSIFIFFIKTFLLVRKNKYDLLYSNGGPFSFIVCFLVSRLIKIDYVIHLHGAFRFEVLPLLLRKLYKDCLSQSKIIFVNSKDTKNKVVKLLQENKKTIIIHNFIDTSIFKPRHNRTLRNKLGFKPNDLIIMSHNRLALDKNIDILMKVVDLCRNNKSIKFLFLGDGIFRKDIIKMQSKNNKILYLGELENENIADYISISDLAWTVCDTSYLSLTGIESLACGIPIISCNISVASEKVERLRVESSTLPSSIGYLVDENPFKISELLITLQRNKKSLHIKKKACVKFVHDKYGSKNGYNLYRYIRQIIYTNEN